MSGQVPAGEIPHGRIRIVALILCRLTIGRLHLVRVKLAQQGDDARREDVTAIVEEGRGIGLGRWRVTEIEQVFQLEFAAGPGVEGYALCPEIGMGRAGAAPAGKPGIAHEIVAEVRRSCLGNVHARLAAKPFAAEPLRHALPLLAFQCGVDTGQNRCRIATFDAEQRDPADGLAPVAQGARSILTDATRNQRQACQLVALIGGKIRHVRRQTRRQRGWRGHWRQPHRQRAPGLGRQRSGQFGPGAVQVQSITAAAGLEQEPVARPAATEADIEPILAIEVASRHIFAAAFQFHDDLGGSDRSGIDLAVIAGGAQRGG